MKLIAAVGGAATVPACDARATGGGRPAEAAADPILGLTALGFQWPTSDPFIFCVHHDDRYPAGNERLGPAASLAGRNLGADFEVRDGWRMYHGEVVPGFPQHPHRGFETVTVVRRGLLDHSDSMGAAARYGGGDVQWLTAGGGIQHAEMFPLLDRSGPNPLELFQIWLNLPRVDKMVEPHFTMLWDHLIPRQVSRDAAGRPTVVRMVAGRYAGVNAAAPPPHSWAARRGSDVAIWTIQMPPGSAWSLPAAAAGTKRSLYFFRGGGLQVGGRVVPSQQRIELRPEVDVPLLAGADETELLLLQGRPIDEPVVQYGPFVMNSTEEIRAAFADYRRTGFGGWPWPRVDPVHAREEGRFARRPDGRIERPSG